MSAKPAAKDEFRRLIETAAVLLLVFSAMTGVPPVVEATETGAAASDDAYMTRSEIEAFMQQYKADHATRSGGSGPAGRSLAWKKGRLTITPYGYINVSASYESEKTLSGDYCAYAFSPETEDASSFQVDAKSSRFGVMIDGPGLPGWHGSKTQGCYEFDFQGQFSVRSRAGFLMRKAFIAVSDKNTKFLAGQDWEVISPLYPMTLNYTAGACVGNNGYRRAMIRLDRRFDLANSTDLLFQFALTDNVLRDGLNSSVVTPRNGSWPVVQGRVAYVFGKDRAAKLAPVTIGMSAHIGEQRFEFSGPQPERKYMRTWSFNVDLDVPLTEKLRFQSEYFLGENLSGTEGGILQGVDFVRRATIRSQGGWAGLQYLWTKKLQTNLCFSIDDPFNEDILGGNEAGGLSRTYNHCLFVNALYHWTEALMTGFEVSFWRTHWQRYDAGSRTLIPMQAGTPTRFEFTVRYSF